MLQAMFSGVSGLQAHAVRMDIIGNNIANVNTVGFKAGRVSFQDQLSQTLRASSGPDDNSGSGGQNPAQVGLGVALGSVDTLQMQGNLQTTGKSSDLAIQGGGFFLVSRGKAVMYTRDGSFDLDSTGALVNSASGQKLLGYRADALGNIDTSIPITADNTIQVPLGSLTPGKQTGNITFSGNFDAGAALYSTKIDYTGNLTGGAWDGTDVKLTRTVYDTLGNPHTLEVTFTNPVDNPSGTGVPAGAVRAWDVSVKTDQTTTYDSTAGKSKIYLVGGTWQFADTATGAILGSAIQMDGGAGANHGPVVPGANGAAPVSINMNFGALTSTTSASTLDGTADGQTGALPTWGTSAQVYDSLGVSHSISFKFTHSPLESGAPPGARGRWDWTAMENGQVIGSSATAGNTPLYFGTDGHLVGGVANNITITPIDGAVSPFTIKIDNSRLTQLASESNATPSGQDGYPVGTLQSFTISADGIITGIYSSGQTRALGQVAVATFSNPGGLEKQGNNLFSESHNTGAAQVGTPDRGGRGRISPGFLEMSNVDLSTEFTNMIITQRGFQASTRIISVVDSLLQDVINLKQ
jgi:flagellar hook protein FlgE